MSHDSPVFTWFFRRFLIHLVSQDFLHKSWRRIKKMILYMIPSSFISTFSSLIHESFWYYSWFIFTWFFSWLINTDTWFFSWFLSHLFFPWFFTWSMKLLCSTWFVIHLLHDSSHDSWIIYCHLILYMIHESFIFTRCCLYDSGLFNLSRDFLHDSRFTYFHTVLYMIHDSFGMFSQLYSSDIYTIIYSFFSTEMTSLVLFIPYCSR